MRQVARFPAALAACSALAVGLVAAAQAVDQFPPPGHKVTICHGTASATNPYVLITVDEHALAGHLDGTAPGHGKKNAPDIVPAPEEGCPEFGPSGPTPS